MQSEDILAVMLDEGRVRVIPPLDSDSETVKNMKYFMLACMHRARLEPRFVHDMYAWFNEMGEEKFLSTLTETKPH